MADSSPQRVISTETRWRVLFVAEAVTLAHAARPAVLADTLNPARYEAYLACDPRYDNLLDVACPRRPIRSIPSAQFLDSLAKGSPLYDVVTLRSYVKEDLAVLDEIQPDVVVGDFRLSLSVSARLRKITYLTISNAYWSPYARQRYSLPEISPTRWLGVALGSCLFKAVRPFAFAYHTRPLNCVRREHGLPSLGLDLRRIYTDADYTLYADIPELVPLYDAPDNHCYLGPIIWSPNVELPSWWHELPDDRPLVYVTLGSSGQSTLLGMILKTLADLDVTVIAATAGRIELDSVPRNAFLADFLPGEEAARRASLVICNGGSPTTQQAIVHGTPVLGIPSNLDQYLNMGAICRSGAGRIVRAGRATTSTIRTAFEAMLAEKRYAENAEQLGSICKKYSAPRRFDTLLQTVLEPPQPRSEAAPA